MDATTGATTMTEAEEERAAIVAWLLGMEVRAQIKFIECPKWKFWRRKKLFEMATHSGAIAQMISNLYHKDQEG